MKIVKCQKCHTTYEMPDVGQEVTMSDCPVCKELAKAFEKLML